MIPEIYDEMRERNTKKILQDGLFVDPVIASSQADTRQGVGVFCMSEFELNPRWNEMINDMAQEFSGQVLYYPQRQSLAPHPQDGILHHTFFQFVKVSDIPAEGLSDDTLRKYEEVLRSAISGLKAYDITYKGMIAIPTGLLMCGYPDYDVNTYRDIIREETVRAGLYFKEPYKADTFHSTVVRLSHPYDSQKLLDIADRYRDTDFGVLRVRELSLMFGSWRMRPDELSTVRVFTL